MERELTPKQCLLVRLWMFGPLFLAMAGLILGAVLFVEPRSLALVWVAVFLVACVALAYIVFRETRYRYFVPKRSSYLDLLIGLAIFIAISYGVEYSNQSPLRSDFVGIFSTSVFFLFLLAPHILFRRYRFNQDQSKKVSG